ncbi:MAG: hypothetical protein ACI30R_08995 [Sodaliphilus sp.]
MKKKMILASFVMALAVGNSCGKKVPAPISNTDADTTVVETVDEAPAEEDNSEAIRNRVTYDLAYYELHGPVHVLKEEYHTVTFNEDGQIIALDGYNPFTVDVYNSSIDDPKIKFTRDSKGRIAEQEGWEFYEKYEWNGMKLASSKWEGEGMWGKCTYSYNSDGLVTTIKASEGDVDNPPTSTTTSHVTYIDFDEYGNWTARKADGNTERRIIKYYPAK